MLFPTISFALFFLIIFPITWLLNDRNEIKKLFLVFVSYVFYGSWNWSYCWLLFGMSVFNFAIGWAIGRLDAPGWRRTALWVGIAGNLSILAYFKYANFFFLEMQHLVSALGRDMTIPEINVALPVAISFLTFHAISYIVDVYWRRIPVERSLVNLSLYLSFFPHLVAGPIVRAELFLPQTAHVSDPKSIRIGRSISLILGGLFKKVVISSHLATLFVDPLYVAPTGQSSVDLWIGLYAYAFVIYCDFSAYTDIAIGIANLLGYEFPQNFNQPYRATSVTDFWRRWHITLSNWLRQYLYIPLGGNRGSQLATLRNLMLTMVLGGLWHGAGIQFLTWGFLHGAALGLVRVCAPVTDALAARWPRATAFAAWFITFHFVCVAWVFFRAPSLPDAMDYLATMLSGTAAPSTLTPFIGLLLAFAALTHLVPAEGYGRLQQAYARLALAPQVAVATPAVFVVVVMAPTGVPPFIYFQF